MQIGMMVYGRLRISKTREMGDGVGGRQRICYYLAFYSNARCDRTYETRNKTVLHSLCLSVFVVKKIIFEPQRHQDAKKNSFQLGKLILLKESWAIKLQASVTKKLPVTFFTRRKGFDTKQINPANSWILVRFQTNSDSFTWWDWWIKCQ
ncbi:hypothetical protein FIS3754_13010 [Fischerella sp. NIES-3754]|nr:hypothetical protein FIS3754_13010 [Fischerella sp. NIES-3754]BCX07667.1 MAG: hypothetical protein KatS3mg066_1526 [Fischerella sp.]